MKALDPRILHVHPAWHQGVPRIMLNKKKHTVGVRIPDHVITQAIVEAPAACQLVPTLSSCWASSGALDGRL